MQTLEVHLNGIFQAVVKRIRKQGLPDGDLQEGGNLLAEMTQVIQIQVVPGIDTQPHTHRELSRSALHRHGGGGILRVVVGVGPGVQLDAVRPHGGRPFHHLPHGIHKN